MKITRKESKQKFYDMYMWLAEHPWAEKQDYFKAHPEIERPCDDCFPCQYENEHSGHYCRDGCIIHWTNGSCVENGSEYATWCAAPLGSRMRAEAARKIAMLAKERR